MEKNKRNGKSHAKAQRRKNITVFAPLRLCVRFVCSVSFVLCVALFLRCGVLLLVPHALQDDTDGYRRLAENLVEHGTFGAEQLSPLPLGESQGEGVPTAFRPPLYPLVLTGCVAFGNYSRGAIGVLHVALGVATVGLVLVLGRCCGLGRRGAAMAALLVACDPILLDESTHVMTETLATFLTAAGWLALAWAGRQNGDFAIAGSQRLAECAKIAGNSPRAAGSRLFLQLVLAGAVLALGALCRPGLLLWIVAVGAAIWWQAFRNIKGDSPIFAETKIGTVPETKIGTVPNSRGPTARGKIARGLHLSAAFALGAIVVLSPWAIRNQIQFGRPIVATTHGGYTLLLGNNPAFYEWLHSGSWGSVWQGDQFNADWERRRPNGELQADRQAYAEAWQTICREPGTFFYACLVRIGRFWSPLPHQLSPNESPLRRLSRYAVALWYIAEYLLVLLGIWRMGRGKRGEGRDDTTDSSEALPALTLALSQRERGHELPSALHLPPSALRPSAFRPSPWLWAFLLVACLLATHAVYWTDMRMRAPVMPVVAIIAASAISGGKRYDGR